MKLPVFLHFLLFSFLSGPRDSSIILPSCPLSVYIHPENPAVRRRRAATHLLVTGVVERLGVGSPWRPAVAVSAESGERTS